ncbi:MAG TPA: proton-conducting transporter membrane subunit [Bryobacteraceae bacterium]|nr:proton-conducting transporter membrane subunit [Bryobacteraceae bacterium]
MFSLPLAILAPLIAVFVVRKITSDAGRKIAAIAATLTLLSAFWANWQVRVASGWLVVDSLNTVTIALFAAITLSTIIFAPRRDCTSQFLSNTLLTLAATTMAYASGNLILFTIAWALGLLPFVSKETVPKAVRAILFISLAALIAGAVLLGIERSNAQSPDPFSMFGAHPSSSMYAMWGFGFLGFAAVLRTGLFPFHSWPALLLGQGPLLGGGLLVNAQLGAFLIARAMVSMLPDAERELLVILSNLGLFTSVYTAILGVVERNPRRLLALLTVSQSAILFAGITSASVEGIAGGLVHWFVIAVSTTGLIGVYRGLEARIGEDAGADLSGRFLGLATQFPRLAVFFAGSSLALVGLPGTLGFCSEDLLLHGSLQADPLIGIAMPLATALNAVQVLRLFSHLFLGTRGTLGEGVPDALPRERWVLSACLLFLVWGGLAPSALVRLQTPAAEAIAGTAQHR